MSGRYEVRPIYSGSFGDVIHATDDAAAAKRMAEEHCWDSYYGTAILDIERQTVDLGDRTVPIAEAFGD